MSNMREISREMLADLPSAVVTAIAVGAFVAVIAMWSGWLAGALP
jgi:hypothetical protein